MKASTQRRFIGALFGGALIAYGVGLIVEAFGKDAVLLTLVELGKDNKHAKGENRHGASSDDSATVTH